MNRFYKIPEDRKQRLNELFEAFSIIGDDTYVYLCDMQYDFSRWSKTLTEEFGLPGEYMYGAGAIWEEHIHPEDREAYHAGIEDIFSGRSCGHDMQYRARRKNGEYDICTCRGIVIKDQSGQPEYFGGAIRNHTQQSKVDKLTGLRNQYGFFEDIQSRIRNRISMRVCVIGIGKFAGINEVYGYKTGNIALQSFGRYLMDHVGNRGGTYRLDGSKFAIITESQTYGEIKKTYEELRTHFRKGVMLGNHRVPLELNAGTLSIDDFTIDDQTVYACVNFAYDESKTNKHGDLVEFNSDLNTDNKLQIEKLLSIRSSINDNYKGFYLLYQPVVDARTEKLIGAEALLRWKNDEYGVVPPDFFIPVLEKDPNFPKLGEWILRKALMDARKIQGILPDFVINVNLSYVQLERLDFTDSVWSVLNSTGFNPEKLCLEITERCRLLDINLLRNIMVTLRTGGVRMALDDFGTGFSSVGLLKNLPFDTIKVDRSFVQKIEEDEKERKLVNCFTEAAGTFGANVCVEGIETFGMRDILKDMNIHSFQGFFYSKPVDVETILASLRSESGELCFKRI